MIEINRNKLIPAKTANWGEITGDISAQKDLMSKLSGYASAADLSSYATEEWVDSKQFATEAWVEGQGYIDADGLSSYATKSWVSEQGYITSEALSGLATESWVETNFLSSVPEGYATKSWVSDQGYLTSVPSEFATKSWVSEQGYITSEALSGYATESWVSSQGFTTSSSFKTVNNESIVGEGNIEVGGLTPEQEEDISILDIDNKRKGYLKYEASTKPYTAMFMDRGTEFFDDNAPAWVYKINNEVYGINWLNPEVIAPETDPHIYIYKFNTNTFQFEHILDQNDQPIYVNGDVPDVPTMETPHFLWEDNQHRVYFSVTHKVDLTTGTFTLWPITDVSHVKSYNGNKNNIVKIDGSIYLLDNQTIHANSRAYIFNNETQQFDTYGTGKSFVGYTSTWYRWVFYYNGVPYFTDPNSSTSSTLRLLYFKITDSNISCSSWKSPWTNAPLPVTYQSAEGNTLYISGDRISSIVKNGVTYYVLIYGSDVWILDNDGQSDYWRRLTNFVKFEPYSYNTNGVEIGSFILGHGTDASAQHKILVWNFTDDFILDNTYWDGSLESRLSTAEGDIVTLEDRIDDCVDLSSSQTISGTKTFDAVNVTSLGVNSIHHNTDITHVDLNNCDMTVIDSIKLTVPCEFTVNDKNIATTDDCILNRSVLPYGGESVTVLEPDPTGVSYTNKFTTHTGRLFYSSSDGDYEFDGTQWNLLSGRLLTGVQIVESDIRKAGTKTFFVYGYGGPVYLWDDVNTQFTQIVSNTPGEVWISGDGELRSKDIYKLVENNGVWSWVEDIVPDYKYGVTYYVNGNVYVLCEDGLVYQYNESTKTYTRLGSYSVKSRSFTAIEDILILYDGKVFKVDFSKVGIVDNLMTLTTIPYTDSLCFYGEYNGHVYYNSETGGRLNYCYGIGESLPEVPNTNGTYVLKAVRTSSGVTYSWVLDEVAQAVQITNEILS